MSFLFLSNFVVHRVKINAFKIVIRFIFTIDFATDELAPIIHTKGR